MAKPDEKKDQAQPDKTIGKKDAPEANNGTPPEEPSNEQADEATQDLADRYARARQEINESVNRLRYEMAQFDAAQARDRARHWVEENPLLAAFLAVGAGIVVGKLLSKAFQPPPPPTFGERVRQQGRVLSSRAQHLAKDVGAVVAERASDAGHHLARQAGVASKNISRHARELGDVVAHRAEEIAETASEQAAELGDVLAERSYDAARTLRKQATHAAHEAKEAASDGLSWAESAVNAAKTVAAAYVVKRVTDWVRRAA